MEIDRSPRVTAVIVGAPGASVGGVGTTTSEAPERGPVPAAFTALAAHA
mgnify:CR=1 FL=1